MKNIICFSMIAMMVAACGNPHISTKSPTDPIRSPIVNNECLTETSEEIVFQEQVTPCEQQQQQQQQQQQDQSDYVVSETADQHTKWSFHHPVSSFSVELSEKSSEGYSMKVFDCKNNLIAEKSFEGNTAGFVTGNKNICNVSMSLTNIQKFGYSLR